MRKRNGRHNTALCKQIAKSYQKARKRRSITRPLIMPLKDYDQHRLNCDDVKKMHNRNMATNVNLRP